MIVVPRTELGCYIDKHGVPTRSSGYIRWETKATSFAHRGQHVLLFSSEFVEIRALSTAKLVQVIEGQDIRQVHASDSSILVAMRGKEDKNETVCKLIELVETEEINAHEHRAESPSVSMLWEEWDM